MIQLKTKINTFSLPTSWADISFETFTKIQTNIDNHVLILEILTGLSVYELSMIDLNDTIEYIQFLKDDPLQIEPTNIIIDVLLPEDIGEKTYSDKINAVDSMASVDILNVISIYSGIPSEDLKKIDCESIFSALNYLVAQLKAIIEKEQDLLKSIITPEQKEAGIDAFNVLGEFNAIDMIARNYAYTHAEVEHLSYNLVFLILLKSNITTKFDTKYSEIINKKK